MSGSNDMATRAEIFHWIAQHENIFSALRHPIGDTGVYFSDTTRNYYPKDFVASYRGVLLLLLQNHVQFQIITPRTLAQFHGKVLVLPDVRVLSDEEAATIQQLSSAGTRVVITGEADKKLAGLGSAVRFPGQPEIAYVTAAEKDFDASNPASQPALLQAIATESDVQVIVSKNVVAHEAKLNGRTYVFFANFDGLKAGAIATPITQHDIRLIVPAQSGSTLHVLPFLGTETVLNPKPSQQDGKEEFVIPEIERGAVVWLE